MDYSKLTKQQLIDEIERLKKIKPATREDENYSKMLEHLPLGIVVFNEKEVFYVNQSAFKMLGFPLRQQKKALGQYNVYDFVLPAFHERIHADLSQIMKGVVFPPWEIQIRNTKGKVIDIEVTSNVINWMGKKAIQTLFYDITDRKLSQRKLIESQNDLNKILSSIDEIVYYADYRNGRSLKFVSDQIEKTLGISKDNYEKKYIKGTSNILNHIHPEDVESVIQASTELKKKKKAQTYSYRFKNLKNNKYLWIQERIYPQLDENGEIVGNFGISRDITKETEARIQLLKTHSTFKILTENATDIIFQFDLVPDPHYSFMCQSVRKILGYSPDSFYKNPYFFHKIIHKEDLPTLQDIEKRLKDKPFDLPASVKTECRYIKRNGKIAWLETRYSFIKDQNGRPLTVIGIANDITKEKDAQLKLQESEEKFRHIAESARDIIFFTSRIPKKHYIYVSPASKKILGYSPEDFYNDPDLIEKTIVDNKKEFIAFIKNLALLERTGKLVFERITFSSLTKSGKVVWQECTYTPVKDENGKIRYVLGIARDITQLKENEIELQQKWSHYQNLVELAPIGIIIHKDGKCLYANDETLKILEVDSKEDLIGKTVLRFFDPSELELANGRMRKAMKGEELSFHQYKIVTDKNNRIDIELKTVPFIYNGENCVQTIITNLSAEKQIHNEQLKAQLFEEANKKLVQEIEFRKKVEKKLIQNELQILDQKSKMAAILENTTHLIWTISPDFRLTSFNGNFSDVVFDKYGVRPKVNDAFAKDLPLGEAEPYMGYWYPLYERVFMGVRVKDERLDYNSNGDEIYREIFLNPIFNGHGEVVEISCIANDITDKVKAAKELQRSEERYRTIINAIPDLIFKVDAEGHFLDVKFESESSLFFKPKEFLGRNIKDVFTDTLGMDFLKNIQQAIHSGKIVFFDYNYTVSNELRYFECRCIKINNEECLVLIRDITEKKINEDKIIQSLKEKEVLLKEVHHRVKNNMQVISSILNLQSSYVKDAYSLNLLKECQNRIKSMAFIHESLYQTKDFASVNFSEYISVLTKNLLHSYSINTEKVKLLLDLDEVAFNLDVSIPCGLIINEIISNSLKYAFPNNREGIIFVYLKNMSNSVSITIGDNGIGLPGHIDYKNTESLGLQLVVTLVEQLNGTIELNNTKGTKYSISFAI